MEDLFKTHWDRLIGIPIQIQYKFHPTREYRFDFAFPEIKLALEMQGYGPGHAAFKEMYYDYVRHNEAVKLGWNIMYFMQPHFQKETLEKTLETVKEVYCKMSGRSYNPPLPKKPKSFMDILKAAEKGTK